MTIEQTTGEGPAGAPPIQAAAGPAAGETAQIARAAGVLALGNIASRVLGLARETVTSHLFGAGALVDAYGVATVVPRMLYDLLIGGMVNGALVPVFSEYAERDRAELWRLVSAFLSLTVGILAAVVLLAEAFAPLISTFILAEHTPETQALGARLLRLTLPAVLFLSLSGALSGLLYALKRFTLPAFTAAVFNAAIVVSALALHRQIGITALALGMLVGSILQVVLQLPGLRDSSIRLGLHLWHPGLKQVGLLYVPTLIPLIFDVGLSRPISYALAAQTGEGGISYLNYATLLVQLPQGLVATAISMAVLPTLSAYAARESRGEGGGEFERTLARGLRLVVTLILPASVGLFVLAHPTVALLYGHGNFTPADTTMTAAALRFYLLGLPFAAVDLLLVYTFYARQDTLTPSLIGIGTIVAYLLLAVALLPSFGLFSLMIADSVKHMLHTLLSALFLRRRLGRGGSQGVYRTLWLVIVAVSVIGLAAYGALRGVEALFPAGGGLAELLAVLVPGLLGAAIYLGLVTLLGVEEIRLLWGTLRQRLTGARG